jgi:hypothetical protein
MDATTIRNLLAVSLESGTDNRRQAELQLKQIEPQPGFMDVLTQVLQTEQDAQVRLSAVIYLKNRVNKAWSRTEIYQNEHLIPEDEKSRLRDNLLPILTASQGPVRVQFIPILQRILHFDFPDKWPTFVPFMMGLLSTNDRTSVLTGFQCLLAVCRTYRYKASESSNRVHFDKIVEASFPRLLAICNELVTQESDEAAEMCHLALKVYKHATWLELSPFLRQRPVVQAWCEVFLRTVAKPLPDTVMAEEDPFEREKHHWAKAKKWAFFVLNRLFARFGNTATSTTKTGADADEARWAKEFTTSIAPTILRHYLQEVEKWVSKSVWISRPCLSYIIVFLDECVQPKDMWSHLRQHITNIVTHFIFPVICLSPTDVEKFKEEPEEYLHRKVNYFEEATAPDVAATTFLVNLTRTRRKVTFEILKFVNAVVNEYEQAPEPEKNHVAKEGALRMIGTLAPVILGKKSPIADSVEYFLVRFVFPDFKSPHGYLRARACDTIEKFEQLNFQNEANLLTIYQYILDCMADSELPVKVTAALALQPLIRHDVIRQSMQQSIPTIMQQLLKLANEVDIDALANVMEDFVEVFSAELTPFAVALSDQLKDTYMRIVSEMLANSKDQDDEIGDFLDDKSITALSVLQTIGTLILTLESTPDVLLHIETILAPVIQVTLQNKLFDLYNEVFEIIDSCTFAAKAISDNMWRAFELMFETFQNGGELYLEDMLPALDNFVQYGAGQLVHKPEYVHSLYTMVSHMYAENDMANGDLVCACKLAEVLMLSLRGSIDKYIPDFVTQAMNAIRAPGNKSSLLKVHLMEVIINGIYYNPALTLSVLDSKAWCMDFFSLWMSSIQRFTRVHDKKLCVLAVSALLSADPSQIPQSALPAYDLLLPVGNLLVSRHYIGHHC